MSAPVLERVQAAAEELGYHPNHLARNMRSGTSRIFGLVISDVSNPLTAVARGAEDAQHGYSLVLSNTDENPEREAATLGVMTAERAAGIIVATTNENGRGAGVRWPWAPPSWPSTDASRACPPTAWFCRQQRERGARGGRHPIRLGHRRIGIIGGPSDAHTARERLRGYERAHREARSPSTRTS
ncbi:MAG: LacI family DNA-binding transcriptional regulator [Chloroflexota bacterium]